MNRRLTTPLILTILVSSFAIGWRNSPHSAGLVSPVNMTLADGRLFVTDEYTGVLVYDVANPASPNLITTIGLRGNRGTAVKDGFVFANEIDDLVVLKPVGDSYQEIARLDADYGDGGGVMDPPNPIWDESGGSDSGYGCDCFSSHDSAPVPASDGGSSYATFAIVGNHLYRVEYSSILVYDIADASKPKQLERVRLNWPIETIYPTDDYLFIGGSRGMYILDRSNPTKPRMVAQVEHVRACDPVVVSGAVAYVTVRGNGGCGPATDALLCVDITSPAQPRLLAQKPVVTPYGLAVREPFVVVANGNSGYTLLDVSPPDAPEIVSAFNDGKARDFIWADDILYLLGFEDVRVYDVTDPRAPVLLARVAPNPS